ncbi:MAG: hypothetical protein H6560_27690 [Lewinellaceae bacterium]|nr:hypothetical protein [Lewinellaceae bacterium]
MRIPLMEDTTFYKFTRGSWETIEGRRNGGKARVNRQFILGEQAPSGVIATVESWEDLVPATPSTFIPSYYCWLPSRDCC